MNLAKLHDTRSSYKNQLHFYKPTNSQKEIKKTVSSTTASKRIKYLDLHKEVKDLYTDEKQLRDTNKWKDIQTSEFVFLFVLDLESQWKS